MRTRTRALRMRMRVRARARSRFESRPWAPRGLNNKTHTHMYILHTGNGDRRPVEGAPLGEKGDRPCGAHKASPRLMPPAPSRRRSLFRGIPAGRKPGARPIPRDPVQEKSSISPSRLFLLFLLLFLLPPFSRRRRPFPLSLRRHVPFSSRRHFVDSFARFARPDQARLALAGRVPPSVRLSVPSARCIAPRRRRCSVAIGSVKKLGGGFQISLSFFLSFYFPR